MPLPKPFVAPILIGLFLSSTIVQFGWAQGGFACDGRYYLSLSTADQTAIYARRIDASGLPPLVRTFDRPLNAVGYRPTDGWLYGIDPQTGDLWRLGEEGNQALLATALLPAGQQYLAGDIDATGQFLYVLAANSGPLATDAALLRINLDAPGYATTETPLSRTDLRSLDLAVDPTDGALYGWDGWGGQLVRYEPDGGVTLLGEPQPPPGMLGGLFFDAFGQLYGYGAGNLAVANHWFAIDKTSGQLSYLDTGFQAAGIDACACYRTLELRARISPQVVPCGTLRYVLTVANRTGSARTGVRIRDLLPPGFFVQQVAQNPYGGDVSVQDSLLLTDLTVGVGIDSIVLELGVLPGTAFGSYAAQATLTAPGLLGARRADNALTPQPGDSVRWQLDGIDPDQQHQRVLRCADEAVTLDPTTLGEWLAWEDGYARAVRPVDQPGSYYAHIAGGCDTVRLHYEVRNSDLFVRFEPATIDVALGDSVRLFPLTPVDNVPVTFAWRDPGDGTLSCLDCPRPMASPITSSTYTVLAKQGDCVDSASVTVLVEAGLAVYFPTAFSPDENGVNDKFYPQGGADLRIRRLELYNRWGEPVFVRRDLPINVVAEGWDGTYRGRAADEGTYVYHALIEAPDGSSQRVTGSVALMR